MSRSKAKPKQGEGPVPLTPSEVKAKARQFFYKLMEEGKSPWPTKFLSEQGFVRKQCVHCHKYFWTANPDRPDCGDSTCAGGYSFLHPDTPPENRLSYHQAWVDFQKSFTTTRIPHAVVRRYPVVARWRRDVDFVAAGIYCFQPFCVSGESEPPGNPLIQCQFCLRFNDLDNIGKTGRHYSGFNMLGIQVFNHAAKESGPKEPYGETEEVYWKDSCIENNYRWCTETLKLKKEDLTFIEDVWQGGGNCGSCVEYFCGGLEIGNMVFTEYAVSFEGTFSPIETKVVDVGIGLERIPWLVNGGWTSYLDVFDYILPVLGEKLGVPIDTPHFRQFATNTALFDVDENSDVHATWQRIGEEMHLNVPSEEDPKKTKLEVFQEELNQFSDLVIVCDHTRSVLFAVEDGALPSNVGGGGNIRSVLRRVFAILKKRNWFEKIGGVDGVLEMFQMHIKGLSGFVPEFKNLRCLDTVIRIEYERWVSGKTQAVSNLKSMLKKKGKKPLEIADWILAIESFGLDPAEIAEISQQPVPEDLWLKFDDHRIRTAKQVKPPDFDVSGIPRTEELFNKPGLERTYEHEATVIKVLTKNAFVCDKTILYPTGGGQEHDDGHIDIDGKTYHINNIVEITNVVVFVVDEDVDESIVGKKAQQFVDKKVRELLRVQHTATHVIAAAARRVLGPHVWQNGAEKTKTGARIDLTHYELPSWETVLEIDRVANELILSGASVHKNVYTRKEAEGTWGFVLYQGGAIPGDTIRVVDIDGIDTEACCGTHCDSLAEIGSVKITGFRKLSDGVVRFEFVAGPLAVESHHADMDLLKKLMTIFSVGQDDLQMNCEKFFTERNAYLAENKKYAIDTLFLQVALGLSKGSQNFIIKRREDNATIFMKGIDNAIEAKPEAADRAIVVIGKCFFFSLIPPAQFDAVKAKFEPLGAEKKLKFLIENNPKKPRKYGHIAFACMSFPPELAPTVETQFKECGFVSLE